MAMAEGYKSNAGRYVIVYICILAIACLQFVIAYSNITASQMFARMLFLAVVEAALALLFFMHLSDNHGLSVVCRRLHGLRAAGDAIWVDGQFPRVAGRALVELFKAVINGKCPSGEGDMKFQNTIRLMGIALAGLFVLLVASSGFFPKLRALLYSGVLRRGKDDSGFAQWDFDHGHSSHDLDPLA